MFGGQKNQTSPLCRLKRVSQRLAADPHFRFWERMTSLLEGVERICSRSSSDAVMTAWLRKPTRGAEQRAIGHGVAVRQRFSAFGRCARLRDSEARSPLEAAGAGVGPSRSRHRPPSTWIIESSPIPPASAAWQEPLRWVPISTHPRPKWPAACAYIVRDGSTGPVETAAG